MSTWIVIVAIGLGTYVCRSSMFVVLGRRSVPEWALTPMAMVAPAAIAALVASLAFTRHGAVHVLPVAELAAVALGFAAVRRTGNVMHAFVAGMPVFWIAQALVG